MESKDHPPEVAEIFQLISQQCKTDCCIQRLQDQRLNGPYLKKKINLKFIA